MSEHSTLFRRAFGDEFAGEDVGDDADFGGEFEFVLVGAGEGEFDEEGGPAFFRFGNFGGVKAVAFGGE